MHRIMDLSIASNADNLVLSLMRFAQKLNMMLKESKSDNIEIPQLVVDLL